VRTVTLRIPDEVQEWFERKAPETAGAEVLVMTGGAPRWELRDVLGLGDEVCILIVQVRADV
jgi:hypothetical protein